MTETAADAAADTGLGLSLRATWEWGTVKPEQLWKLWLWVWLVGGLGFERKEGNGFGDFGEGEDEFPSHHQLSLHCLVQVEDREDVEEGCAKVVAEATSFQAGEEEGRGEELPHLPGQVLVAMRRGGSVRLQGVDVELEEELILADLEQVDDRVLLREGAEDGGTWLVPGDNLQRSTCTPLAGEAGRVGWLADPA